MKKCVSCGKSRTVDRLGECHECWENEHEMDFDPENIYRLPSIRQSIEEDRK